jgi:hypothetical protein
VLGPITRTRRTQLDAYFIQMKTRKATHNYLQDNTSLVDGEATVTRLMKMQRIVVRAWD